MYMCIYIYIYAYVCICMYVCIYIYIHTCMICMCRALFYELPERFSGRPCFQKDPRRNSRGNHSSNTRLPLLGGGNHSSYTLTQVLVLV